jgi:cytochrome c oxidase subunit II
VSGGVPTADSAGRFSDLFSVYEWLMIAVTAIVFGLVLFAIYRYRRRGAEYPEAKGENTLLESAYAVLLTAVAIVLVSLTFRTEDKVDAVASTGGVRVDVVAFQWQWRFSYPKYGKVVLGTAEHEPILVLPVRTLVRFDGVARDVIHSFWIPAARFKRDEFPKRHSRWDLSFERTGTFIGRCAEFCGLHHADMDFYVRVVPMDEFRRWVGTA